MAVGIQDLLHYPPSRASDWVRRTQNHESNLVSERFDWMRRELLLALGGSHYLGLECTILKMRGERKLWLGRDDEGNILVNVDMPTVSTDVRLQVRDNVFYQLGSPSDFRCPPSGKLIDVAYEGGDRLRIEFVEVRDQVQARERFKSANPAVWDLPFPLTCVEVTFAVGGTSIKFGKNKTHVGIMITGGFFRMGSASDAILTL